MITFGLIGIRLGKIGNGLSKNITAAQVATDLRRVARTSMSKRTVYEVTDQCKYIG